MRRRKAEQKKQSRERKKQKRLLKLERKREGNKTMISYRDQQVVNMEEERETPSTNTRLKRREESVEATSLPKYQVGNTALLEANTKGRGCNLFYISSFCIHSQMYATLLVRFS